MTANAPRGARPTPSPPPPTTPLRGPLRLLAAIAWTVLGLLAYFICQGMFGGYQRFHSALLTTLGMIAIALTGGITWIIDERRPHDDE
jgi:hypothetical protein